MELSVTTFAKKWAYHSASSCIISAVNHRLISHYRPIFAILAYHKVEASYGLR